MPEHLITIDGQTRSITEWAQVVNIDRHIIYGRIRRGLSGPALIAPKNDPITALSAYHKSVREHIVIGKRYNDWTIIAELENEKDKRMVRVQCVCGNERIAQFHQVKGGRTKRCQSCAKRANATTHGLSKTPEYHIHAGMLQRCNNPKDIGYATYGGRGIKVCETWSGSGGFLQFWRDMGPRPGPEFSLDRIDVDGNYEPSNCRWATPEIQAKNKQANKRMTQVELLRQQIVAAGLDPIA